MRSGVLFLLGMMALVPETGLAVETTAAAPMTSEELDTEIDAYVKKKGLVAAGSCDDATFLRRVYLDLVGTLPGAPEAAEFLDDGSPDKRTRMVDQLLASQEFSSSCG
jgi:hypothetical protein